ncbi:MAG: hypothetical protein KBC02_00895 [Candidatus Pacebacteria bacterium]|nr:hypothetical protein [Candidatus Paceibacterota bacterium]
MSIIHEIQRQHPTVRRALFVMSLVISVSVVGVFTASSVQQTIYFGIHSDPAEQEAFLAAREAGRPQPLAAISKATGSLIASIGSLIGWDTNAGFDSNEKSSNTQGGVHLLPLSE